MFEIEDIRAWRGYPVMDVEGKKIGELEAIYVDTGTDLPSFATVKVGLPGRQRLVFVPLSGSKVGPGHLRVAYDKKQVKSAPPIGTDGELRAGSEGAVFAYYELPYHAAPNERLLARR